MQAAALRLLQGSIKVLKPLSDDRKAKLTEGAFLGLADELHVEIIVTKQLGGPGAHRFGLIKISGNIREGDPLDRAIAAHAGDASEQAIPGDLAWDVALVQLKDDPVSGQHLEIVRIGVSPGKDLDAGPLKVQAGIFQPALPLTAFEIEEGERQIFPGPKDRAQSEERGEMLAGRGSGLASTKEYASAFSKGNGEVPGRLVDRIGRGDELRGIVEAASEILIKRDEPGGGGDRSVGPADGFPGAIKDSGIRELPGDLKGAGFLKADEDWHSSALKLKDGLECLPEVRAEKDQAGAGTLFKNLFNRPAEPASGAGRIGMEIHRRMPM